MVFFLLRDSRSKPIPSDSSRFSDARGVQEVYCTPIFDLESAAGIPRGLLDWAPKSQLCPWALGQGFWALATFHLGGRHENRPFPRSRLAVLRAAAVFSVGRRPRKTLTNVVRNGPASAPFEISANGRREQLREVVAHERFFMHFAAICARWAAAARFTSSSEQSGRFGPVS